MCKWCVLSKENLANKGKGDLNYPNQPILTIMYVYFTFACRWGFINLF